ncbi:MAG: TetR family transcriptional regulator C-terminal domain-containing protein, partial [Brevibacterium aurantiacum]
ILMNEAALAATREPELGRCLATLWDDARRTIADWLRAVAPHIADPDAVAATIAATIDGAAIQHSIDPRTRLEAIAEQLTILAHPSPSPEGKAPPDEH